MIYVAHPHGGNSDNFLKVTELLNRLRKANPNDNFISPLHCYAWEYYENNQELGMKNCLELLSKCDELILGKGWRDSKGCVMEFEYAIEHGIKTYNMDV